MIDALKAAYEFELDAASSAREAFDHDLAFHHLARAHILAQRHTFRHVRVHWLMLRLGTTIRDWQEVSGQIARIFAAALFSRIWIPAGNTGRANVGAMKPMPAPDDLRALLDEGGQ